MMNPIDYYLEQQNKIWYAVYSEKAKNVNNKVFKYNLINVDGSVECTAVYPCEDYSSGEDVLNRGYLWDDAVVVGVVDRYLGCK